ncbi:MAG: hypothetical protein JST84_31760 [Acidobacteria bacterium]|nr:hypothetical protein [Acidobacteriota bacterium]
MAKKNKQPKYVQQPKIEKKPVTESETSFNQARPAWRLSLLQLVDPWGWHTLDQAKLIEIQGKLSGFETMTWNEILVVAKKQHHSIPVSDLTKKAQGRLQDIKQDDVDELISLRLQGKERVWGIREEQVLKLLWWDPEHEICPSLLKNT